MTYKEFKLAVAIVAGCFFAAVNLLALWDRPELWRAMLWGHLGF